MDSFSRYLLGTLTVLVLSVGGPAAYAATFCSDVGGNQDGLQTSDMTFEGSNSDDCYGLGVIAGPDGINPDDIIDELNENEPLLSEWGGGWTELVKDDNSSGGSGPGTFEGVTFVLEADNDASSGTWTLSWSGAGLPMIIDFVGVLNAGSKWAAYLFENVTLAAEPDNMGSGTFTITWTAGQGASTSNPGLSGLILYVRLHENGDDPPTQIPEPGTMLLLGAGLLGLGWVRRRRGVSLAG